jgi:rSAM/selenodomain-associated transferase 1
MIKAGTPTLIVMAKAPRLGAGKTRLAKEIGRLEAWRINRALQAHTLHAACDPRWRTLLCITPNKAGSLTLPHVWPPALQRIAQGGGDLGERLARTLAPHRCVAVIGTDCPLLTRTHIAQAFAALKRAPFALGPTHDGGFWLLAARSGSAASRAMANVRWSSEHAAADVLRNLRPARVHMLAMLRDVDVLADLKDARAQRSAKRLSSGL